jgi:hypothetical protein
MRALPDTPGEHGTDARIEFALATVDPNGNPTSGITHTVDDDAFEDIGPYYDALSWDTNRYLNVYTNRASGALGYVYQLPQGGGVGSSADRVVILWAAFGRGAPIGPPFDMGRDDPRDRPTWACHTFEGLRGVGRLLRPASHLRRPEAAAVNCPATSVPCGGPDPFHNLHGFRRRLHGGVHGRADRPPRCPFEDWRPTCRIARPAALHFRNAGANGQPLGTPPILGAARISASPPDSPPRSSSATPSPATAR